jgi:hypothetical protein
MIAGVGLEPELAEDDPDVGFHGALGQAEHGGDRQVGPAFRDQLQHIAFTRRQVVEGAAGTRAPEQRRDDLRIDDGPACGHPLDGIEEFGEVGHSILEQVTDAPRGVAQEPDDVLCLDVLRQDQEPDLGGSLADRDGSIESLRRLRRRHPDIDDRHIRMMRIHECAQLVGIGRLPDDHVAGHGQGRGERLPKQRAVVGQD